jgi:hypothetical protein
MPKLCRLSGGALEQIQFLLGHASVQTTERYLGGKQELQVAVNDKLGWAIPPRPGVGDACASKASCRISGSIAGLSRESGQFQIPEPVIGASGLTVRGFCCRLGGHLSHSERVFRI